MGARSSGPVWRLSSLAVLALIAGIASGCDGEATPVESPVSEEEAMAIAENALAAFNSGDYAAWSRDWSETMRTAIDEAAFQSFRDQYHEELGDFVSIRDATGAPGNDAGTYRWTYDVEFQNMDYTVWFGFKDGSKQVEGVSFEEPAA